MINLIKSNPYFFALWYHLYRQNRGVKINYFSSKTTFLLDGYPRSGNTFFSGLCKNIFGEQSFVHHFHAIAPIKIALTKNIPVFILIRQPEQVISSYYLKSYGLEKKKLPKTINMKLLRILANRYLEYYSFINQHRNELHLIVFENFIVEPIELPKLINKIVYKKKYHIESKTIEEYKISYRGATDTLGSSKPNAAKEKLKSKINQLFFLTEEYKKSVEIYSKLINRDD